jgi:hypothetical protein
MGGSADRPAQQRSVQPRHTAAHAHSGQASAILASIESSSDDERHEEQMREVADAAAEAAGQQAGWHSSGRLSDLTRRLLTPASPSSGTAFARRVGAGPKRASSAAADLPQARQEASCSTAGAAAAQGRGRRGPPGLQLHAAPSTSDIALSSRYGPTVVSPGAMSAGWQRPRAIGADVIRTIRLPVDEQSDDSDSELDERLMQKYGIRL